MIITMAASLQKFCVQEDDFRCNTKRFWNNRERPMQSLKTIELTQVWRNFIPKWGYFLENFIALLNQRRLKVYHRPKLRILWSNSWKISAILEEAGDGCKMKASICHNVLPKLYTVSMRCREKKIFILLNI